MAGDRVDVVRLEEQVLACGSCGEEVVVDTRLDTAAGVVCYLPPASVGPEGVLAVYETDGGLRCGRCREAMGEGGGSADGRGGCCGR